MDVTSVLLAIIAVIPAALYFYVKHKHSYWARRGVKHDQPTLIFGNLGGVFTLEHAIYEFIHKQYFKYSNEKVVGFYGFSTPMIIIRDLDIIKDICVKDFNSFVNRSFKPDKRGDPLAAELMFGKWDDAWRTKRQEMSFAFTNGRTRKMYSLVSDVGGEFNKLCYESIEKGKAAVNMREYCNRYAIDVVTRCAFGSKGNAISAPEQSVLYRVLNDIFNFTFGEGLAFNLMFIQKQSIYAFLSRLGLGVRCFRKQIENDIYNVVDTAAKERLKSGERRGDIFDDIVFSDSPEFKGLEKQAGAAFQVLLAGTETSSSTIMFTLYELAKHPEIQRKLQKEIRDNLKKHNGEIPYDDLNKMEYLDQVFKESLRLFPILPFLDRVASKDYTIAGTDIVIEKGTAVFIPVWAPQMDPQYFPDPEAFRPERFSQDKGQSYPEMAYLPFGAGPRYCPGDRLGITSVKSCLVYILKDFDVDLTDESRKPLTWNKKSFFLTLEKGMILAISPSKHID